MMIMRRHKSRIKDQSDEIYKGHSAALPSRSGGDVSDLDRNFLYESICRKIHTQFFLVFVFKISFKKKKEITIFEDGDF